MSEWSTQTDTVRSVLTTVVGHLGDSEASEGSAGNILDMDTAVQGDASECSAGMPVSSAIGMSMERFSPICGQVVRRTSSALSGCAETTEHYVTGDYEMAAEAQSARLDTPITEGDLPQRLTPGIPPCPSTIPSSTTWRRAPATATAPSSPPRS